MEKNKGGWISLHRSVREHWIWDKSRVFSDAEAWIDLLLHATHTATQVRIKMTVFTVERGEQIRSLKTLADTWNWSRSRVRRFLELLQKENMIRFKSETQTTRISICNYDTYQDSRNANETEVKRNRNASETRADTDNNGNKGNNANNENNIPEQHGLFSEVPSKPVATKPQSNYTHEFEVAWEAYGRRGSKKKAFQVWKRLDQPQKQKASAHIPQYVASVSDSRYIKHMERYLGDELFEQYTPELKAVSIYS